MCLAYFCLFACVCVFFNSSMFLVDLMYFYVSVLYLYTVSVNQALCSMLAAATGPLLLILLKIDRDIVTMER